MHREITVLLQRVYPEQFDFAKVVLHRGNAATVQQLQEGIIPEKTVPGWGASLSGLWGVRRKYFLYK